MFKRLADRVSSAVASVAGIPNTQNPNPNPNPNGRQSQSQNRTATATATAVHRLRSLGFSDADARQALQVTNGNVDAAAEWLFGNASGTAGAPGATATATATATTEDDELRRAISASLEQQAARPQPSQPPQPPQSAAAKRAGHAALARFQQQGPTNKSTNKSTNKNKSTNTSTSTSTNTWHGTAKPKPKPKPKQKQNEAKAAPRSDSTPFAATNNNNNNKNNKNNSVAIASHPTVKVPKRLSQHDKEDVILRCAQRVAPYPTAVDTLLRSLTQLKQNPSDLKFRTIDTSTAGFQRSLNVPGALDFFKAMGYHHVTTNTHTNTHINTHTNTNTHINTHTDPNINTNNLTVLELSFVDPATLYLGISALEQIQETSPEYHANKILFKFDKELQQILALADSDMDEALKRSQHMSKVPSEPTMGGGQITVELGSRSRSPVAAAAAAVATNTNTNHTTHKISRKFDGDDCLEDILHWMGGHGSLLYDKLVSGEWFLVNRNHRDGVAYNIPDLKTKTLQYMGCWPSGRLAVVPTRPSASSSRQMPTSSRGLGAAPMDALKL